MRILVVQNSRTAPAGLVGAALAEGGAQLVTVRADEGEPLPATTTGFAGLLVLGGPQDAWDDERSPYLPRVLDLIRGFADGERPVMGLCLGAQLIARAYGARVYRNHRPELGFTPVRLTAAAAADPLLHGMGPDLMVMQWHYDTFDLPEGAERLAGNAVCAAQAFRLGGGVHAFQFHIEADAAIARGWAARYGAEKREESDRSLIAGLEEQLAEHMPASADRARTIAGRWLERAARHGA